MTWVARRGVVLAALLAPVALFPLLLRPELGIGAALAAVGALLAWVSPGVPLGLGGGEALVPILGFPAPDGAVRIASFAWLGATVAFVGVRAPERLRAAALLAPPVLGSFLLLGVMVARLGGSPAYEYGATKAQLFLVINVIVLVVGVLVAQHAGDLRLFVLLALGSALLAAVLTVGTVLGGGLTTLPDRYSISEDQSPIWLGRQTGAGLLIALWLVLAGRRGLRTLALGALPFLAIAFLSSGSRGPVVALILALIALVGLSLWTPGSGRARVPLLLGVVVAAVAVASQTVPSDTLARVGSIFVGGDGSTDASNGRSRLWEEAWRLFVESPLTGAGTGAFAAAEPLYRYPHNLLLEAAAEWGLVGLAALGTVLVSGTISIVRALRRDGAGSRQPAVLVATLYVFFLANAMFSGDITGNSGLWLALGLGVGLDLAGQAAARRPRVRPAGRAF